MGEIFKIRKINDKDIIERVTYPRFRATIYYNCSVTEITEMEYLDNCSFDSKLAIKKEVNDFFNKYQAKIYRS